MLPSQRRDFPWHSCSNSSCLQDQTVTLGRGGLWVLVFMDGCGLPSSQLCCTLKMHTTHFSLCSIGANLAFLLCRLID